MRLLFFVLLLSTLSLSISLVVSSAESLAGTGTGTGTGSESLIFPLPPTEAPVSADNVTSNCTDWDCNLPFPPTGIVDPSPAPTARLTRTPSDDDDDDNDWDAATSIDILVAALFLIAAGWLILAIIYSVLILIVVRMRARGELDIYDENFGRIFLWGSRFYIPLGCILRRHVVAHNRRNESVRLMTREERRRAMELLLKEGGNDNDRENGQEQREEATGEQGGDIQGETEQSTPVAAESNNADDNVDTESNGEPVCSICLMEYGECRVQVESRRFLQHLNTDPCYRHTLEGVCFTSPTCVHRFHRDCLMDWLERRNHTECPCCREPMVADGDVWDMVQQIRKHQRKLRRQQNRNKGILGRFTPTCCRQNDAEETYEQGEADQDVEEGNSNDQELAAEMVPAGHREQGEEEANAVAPEPVVEMAVPLGHADQEREIQNKEEGNAPDQGAVAN